MMSKHTPGPWHVDGYPTLEAPEIHSEHRRVAKALYHRGSEDKEVAWNAYLIAAAPDLLTACKAQYDGVEALREWLNREQIDLASDVLAALQKGRRQYRAAIAKVERE